MKLSCFFDLDKVYRDSDFYALGLSNSNPGVPFLTYIDNTKFLGEIQENKNVVAIICKREHLPLFVDKNIGIIIVDNPRKTYFQLHNILSNDKNYYNNLENTIIGENCSISKLASISYSGVKIGKNVIIEDFVKIQGPCIIGDNTVIHSGCVIGGSGYEFKRYSEDILDVIHCGSVEIGENVIIWENVTIHKAVYPWDTTKIGSWCRVGALTHIDHGAKIEELVEVCARCTISGRTYIGKHAFVGPGSIISNRIHIGDNAKVLLGSVVTKDVEAEQVVSGNFAIEHDKHISSVKADSLAVLR